MKLPQHIAEALAAIAAKLPHVAPMKGIPHPKYWMLTAMFVVNGNTSKSCRH